MQNIDLVVKIGSMALIQKEDSVIDYNVFQRLAMALRPGMILVSSGATEIGRLDYIQRTGHELTGEKEQIKVDYSAQGQSILMNNYRTFIRPEYRSWPAAGPRAWKWWNAWITTRPPPWWRGWFTPKI